MLLAFAAHAALPPCADAATPPEPVQVSVTTHGHTVGGLGIASLTPEGWSLTLLAPAGIELFTVSGPPTTVATGLDKWRPWLEQLPVERDLRLAFTPVSPPPQPSPRGRGEGAGEGVCTAGDGRIRTELTPDGWTRRWHGPGGCARATRSGGKLVLVDRRRGYTLTIVGPTAPEGDASR